MEKNRAGSRKISKKSPKKGVKKNSKVKPKQTPSPKLAGPRAKAQAENSRPSALRVKIWGARGSLPTPIEPHLLEQQIRRLLTDFVGFKGKNQQDVDQFLKEVPRHRFGGYGGNTPCVEVTSAQHQLIIDGGSGLRLLGNELMKGPCAQGKGKVHIFFTHFHWDHLVGLPFFTPLFVPGNEVHVYSVQPELETVFRTVFKKPYFPVEIENLGARIIYHRLEPRKKFPFGDMQVTPYQLDHPDPCWGYKIEKDGRAYSHCVDTECLRMSARELGPDLPLYQNVDLMVFDAQYTLVETIEKVNWGHAAASLGLDLAMREKVKKVVFVHHDPASSNEKIAEAERQARAYYNNQLKHARISEPYLEPVEWVFGYEGMVLEV